MTSKIELICIAINSTRQDPQLTLSEDPGRIDISGLMSKLTLAAWQSAIDVPCGLINITCKDDSDDLIRPADGIAGSLHRLSIIFTTNSIAPNLFTMEGWRSFLYSESAIESAELVRLAFIDEGFETMAFRVEPWIDLTSSQLSQKKPFDSESSPRRQVRSQNAEFIAPARIEPWILKIPSIPKNLAVDIWSEIAAKRIISSLANELYRDDEIGRAHV